MTLKILYGPSDEEFREMFDRFSVLTKLEKYKDWKYDRKFYPTDQEIINALKDLSAQEIVNETIKYELGDLGFKLAVDKGILDNLTPNEILMNAVKACSLKYVQYAVELGANIDYSDNHGISIKKLNMNEEIRKYLSV